MKAVKQISRVMGQVKGPLRVVHSGAGTCGLPAEIWLEIFKVATTLLNEDHELQVNVPSDSIPSCSTPTILNAFFHDQRSELFRARRTITLVCKSWYIMGISLLYSHVFINLDSHRQVQNLHDALQRNPAFPPAVVRLSVIVKRYYDHGIKQHTAKENAKFRLLFETIVNRLTQLKIVTCPSIYANWLNITSFPPVCILYWERNLPSWSTFEIPASNPCFWERAHTLSFCMNNEPWHAGSHGDLLRNVVLPNLVNLRLNIGATFITSWIVRHWSMPKLRALSLHPQWISDWTPLLSRLSSSLEILELSLINDIDIYQQRPPISMPSLTTLCIFPPATRIFIKVTRYYIGLINAPNLRQFALHIYPPLYANAAFALHNPHYSMQSNNASSYGDINEALTKYRKVKNIKICYSCGTSAHEMMEDGIKEWREKGLSVEETQSHSCEYV